MHEKEIRHMEICPSMMCANFDYLKDEVIKLDEAGTDIFHIDIMDGSFVPNFAMGYQDILCIRKNTEKMIDVHLMMENPSKYINLFIHAGVDLIYVHPESERYVSKTIAAIQSAGKLAGIAVNPDTSLETISELFPLVDYILVMTVNPGFSGQKYLDFVTNKIDKLLEFKKKYPFKIVIDGACSHKTIETLSKKGVDGFVLGTSALFGKEEDYKTIIHRLKKLEITKSFYLGC